ncbi:hypothetical protein, partial [Rhizobium leguminosarum]
HGISCSWHLSRSQAEIPLIPAVQISRASSARTNTQTARRSGFDAALGQFRHKAPRRERA